MQLTACLSAVRLEVLFLCSGVKLLISATNLSLSSARQKTT